MAKWKEIPVPNIEPTITAALLSEYCFASAIRRQRIIEQMRDEEFEPFKDWYREPRGAYRRYLITQCETTKPLEDLISLITGRSTNNEHIEAKAEKQIEAIESIIDTPKIYLANCSQIFPCTHNLTYIDISGVKVRVNPIAIAIRPTIGTMEKLVGVIKPYWNSTSPLSEKRARIYSALLHWYVEYALTHLGKPDRSLCCIPEIFTKKVHIAPKAIKRIRKEIEANCAEISERWYKTGTSIRFMGSKLDF